MAKRNQFDDIVFHIPESFEMEEATIKASTRKRRAATADTADDLVLSVLADEHKFSVEKTVVLNRRPESDRRSAAASADDQKMRVSIETEADEQAVILLEEDGVYRWAFPKQTDEPQVKRSRRGRAEKQTLDFEIDLSGYEPLSGQRRGLWDGIKSLAKKTKAHVIKFRESHSASKFTVKRLEKKVVQCVINMKVEDGHLDASRWEQLEDISTLRVPKTRPAKLLLFIHGTFSSTLGSYGGLCGHAEGQSFLEQAAEEYDLILGFDHYTLSESPLENAWELLKRLKTINWSKKHPTTIDIVGYSRGGLVVRSLIEKELPRQDEWKVNVRKAIFIGATNGGTQLAKPENWYRFIDFYTNIAVASTRVTSLLLGGGVAGLLFGGMIRGLGAFAKYMATSSVTRGEIPGLSAMEPGGAFVQELNQTQPGQPTPETTDYYAVTSNFDINRATKSSSPGLPKRLAFLMGNGLVDQLMNKAPNDLVVDTASMTTIDPHVDGLIKEVNAFGDNGQVYHTVYMLQPATVQAFHRWLELPGELAVSEPEERSTRNVFVTEDEPVAFETLAPQIMKMERRPVAYGSLQEALYNPDVSYKTRPKIKVSVYWDDITKAEGDVYAVGHYRNVLPQSAELAIDHQVSQQSWGKPWFERRQKLVLTRLTEQGLLVGDIGEVDLFPWGDKSQKLAAICGMGYFNGDFSEQNLQLLFRKLVWKLNTLPGVDVLCSVLIGSGVGSLDTRRALRGMLSGTADALAACAYSNDRIEELRIVEYDSLKAQEIYDELVDIRRRNDIDIELIIDDEVKSEGTGKISDEHTMSLILGSMLHTFKSKNRSKRKTLFKSYIESTGLKNMSEDELEKRLNRAWKVLEAAALDSAKAISEVDEYEGDAKAEAARVKKTAQKMLNEQALARKISVKLVTREDSSQDVPNRISIRRQNGVYRIAGLTSSSAIPEREISVDETLVHELIERMTDTDVEKVQRHGKVLYQLLVPGEFEELLTTSNSLIFEVDRNTAPIHWEMLVFPGREQAGAVGLTIPVSRQLRTTYSNIPTFRANRDKKALVIGNPDGTLEFAEDEALEVARVLNKHGYSVDTFIGPPNQGVAGHPTANRLDVLEKLFEGNYDIVHYAGHGDYKPDNPSETGWVFSSGLLTAAEMERLKDAPALIFANACLSGLTSRATRGDGFDGRASNMDKPKGEAGLLPSLADEVLKLGVKNYIGTAWEIDDKGAVLFASTFYEEFLAGKTVGEAMHTARKTVARYANYGALWAAYQHYGSPDFGL